MNGRIPGLLFLTQPHSDFSATRSCLGNRNFSANAAPLVGRDAHADEGISFGQGARLDRAFVSYEHE